VSCLLAKEEKKEESRIVGQACALKNKGKTKDFVIFNSNFPK